MAASTTGLPQKLRRASSHATPIPSGVATSVATVATRSESWIAVHSVGEISNTLKSGGRTDQESEAIFFQNRLRHRGAQEGEIIGGFRPGGRRPRGRLDSGGAGLRPGPPCGLDAGVG